MNRRLSLASLLVAPLLLSACGGEDTNTAIKQATPPDGLFFGFHKPDANSVNVIQLGSAALYLQGDSTPIKSEFSFQYNSACQPSNNILLAGLKAGSDVAGSGATAFDRRLSSSETLPLTIEFAGDYTPNPELSSAGYYGGLYGRKASEQPLNQQTEQRRYKFCEQSYQFQPKGTWFVFAENEHHPQDFKVAIEQSTQQVTWSFPSNFTPQTALVSFYDRNKLTKADQPALVRQITTTAIPARISLPTDFNLSAREYTVVVQLFDDKLTWGAIGQTQVTF